MADRPTDITVDEDDDADQHIRNGEVIICRPLWESTDLESPSTVPGGSMSVEGVGGEDTEISETWTESGESSPEPTDLTADSFPSEDPSPQAADRDTTPSNTPPPTTARISTLFHRSAAPGISAITTGSAGAGVGVGFWRRRPTDGTVAAVSLAVLLNACFLLARWLRGRRARREPEACEEGRAEEDGVEEGEEARQR
jgi:hypothetical protein